MKFINLSDYILIIPYVACFYIIIVTIAKKTIDISLRKYFVYGFFAHLFGSFLYCLVIQYYYGYGDSFGFYMGSNYLRSLWENEASFLETFFFNSESFINHFSVRNNANELPIGISIDSNFTVMKISAILSYFCFNSYIIISFLFGLFSYWGQWKLFTIMNKVLNYKKEKILVYCIIFIPSACFWGGGLIKDSLCLGTLGLIIFYIYNLLIEKKIRISSIVMLFFLIALLYLLKTYLVLSLIICLILTYLIYLFTNNKGSIIKLTILSIALIICFLIVLYNTKDSLNSIIDDAKGQIDIFKNSYASQENIEENSKGSFNAVDFDLSPLTIIVKSPQMISSTIFRPFVWETRKPIMFFSALESCILLIFTLYLVIKAKFFIFFKSIFTNPYIFFAFSFSIIIGAIVGFTTFNFGTLVRYRLPLIPFYTFSLLAIHSLVEKK